MIEIIDNVDDRTIGTYQGAHEIYNAHTAEDGQIPKINFSGGGEYWITWVDASDALPSTSGKYQYMVLQLTSDPPADPADGEADIDWDWVRAHG